MTEVTGSGQPEIPEAQTPTEASNGFLHKMNEAGSAGKAALWGIASGGLAAFALNDWVSGDKIGAVLKGVVVLSSGLFAAKNIKES